MEDSERAWTAPEHLVIIGHGYEFDCELEEGPRLAIGKLGDEVKDRWGCKSCEKLGADVWVERYDESTGSGFALCNACVFELLGQRLSSSAEI